jgi:hypothetical protein
MIAYGPIVFVNTDPIKAGLEAWDALFRDGGDTKQLEALLWEVFLHDDASTKL